MDGKPRPACAFASSSPSPVRPPLAHLCNSRQTAAGDCSCFLPGFNPSESGRERQKERKMKNVESVLHEQAAHLPQTCFRVKIRISWSCCSLCPLIIDRIVLLTFKDPTRGVWYNKLNLYFMNLVLDIQFVKMLNLKIAH